MSYRVVIGGIPERPMAEGIRMVLGVGDDIPDFLTFTIEDESVRWLDTKRLAYALERAETIEDKWTPEFWSEVQREYGNEIPETFFGISEPRDA